MHDDKEDMKLHVTLIVDVVKGKDSDVLEFVCSGWPDGIEIRNVFTRGHDRMKDQPYMGPKFKYVVRSSPFWSRSLKYAGSMFLNLLVSIFRELDDELQDSLYDFLEARGVDDKLAEFLHTYMRYKDKNEYLRWMESMKTYIQKK